MPFLLCYKLVSDGQLWAVANGDDVDGLKKHISSYAMGTTFTVYEVPADFDFKQRLAPPLGDLQPVYTWCDGGSAEDAAFLKEPVKVDMGGKATAEFTLTLDGLADTVSPVVGLFGEEGELLGRTEVVKTTTSAVFQKQFVVSGNPRSCPDLKFSVYDFASGSISADNFIGSVAIPFKNVLNGTTVELNKTSGSLSIVKKPRPKKEKKPQQQKKKADKKNEPKEPDAKAIEKLHKKCMKEGGKKGQDIVGLSEMGGVSFFHVSLDSPDGNFDNMEICLAGFNKPVDENADDRKGGAGLLGKFLFSYNLERLIYVCHLPKKVADEKEVTAQEWFDIVNNSCKGEVVSTTETEEGGVIIRGQVKADPENNRYPIKMRDEAISISYQWLCKRQLVLAEDSSDDECYGDDDFDEFM